MIEHPTGRKPKRVALIGAGPSMTEWPSIMAASFVGGDPPDEVWGINAIGRAIRCDLSFVMDDYAALRGHVANVQQFFETAEHPIITSVPRPNCPTAVAYPLVHALALPGARQFLNHTAAYAVAYAILIGVEELMLFGCDYINAGQPYHANGPDRPPRYLGCISYWLGIAAARGMDVVVCPRSPLLDSDLHPNQRFYGYLVKPVIRHEPADVASAQAAA